MVAPARTPSFAGPRATVLIGAPAVAAQVVIQRSPALHPVQQLKKIVPVNGAHR